jgi:hypothetical protein
MPGKNINYFLMDGTPGGRIKCTISNWTGVAYRIPRTELEKCKERDDLKQSGVYFLFGIDEDTGDSVVYVGQAGVRKNGEGILYRLQEHKRKADKDYWTEAVVFTTSNNSFGPTEISWLENRFCALAMNAKRYIIKNGNDPTLGNVTEEKESELEEFVDYAKVVMGVLGRKIFEPLTVSGGTDVVEQSNDASVTLEIKTSSTDAKGRRTSEGFVLLNGSKIKLTTAPSAKESLKILRKRYAAMIDEGGILKEDILLRSPNEAAKFVVGHSINALTAWKTADGKTLKELENSEIIENNNTESLTGL